MCCIITDINKRGFESTIVRFLLFMSNKDDLLFNENIITVNKMVIKVLLVSLIVPASFIIFTLINYWMVPHLYSLSLIIYILVFSTLMLILNKFEKFQKLTMYLGIFGISILVALLGYKGIIAITVSYCFGPVISCLYYNRKLTLFTSITNAIITALVFYFRSFTMPIVKAGIEEPMGWYLSNVIGLMIEFIFVTLICDTLARRTHKTMQILIYNSEARETANRELAQKNEETEKINKELENVINDLQSTQVKIIEFVAKVLGSHDLFTGRHVMHTPKYLEIIAKELRNNGFYTEELTDTNIQIFSTAAFLHDIGKIHVPEGVLNKVGKFNDKDFQLMKSHPEEGKKLLEALPPIQSGYFNLIAIDMAYNHHEKWDGSGYPNGIKGNDIPLCARLMAAADVLDALISQRLYKEPMKIEDAMKVFEESKGTHFEPCIAQSVINCQEEIRIIDKEFKDLENETNEKELAFWKEYHSM